MDLLQKATRYREKIFESATKIFEKIIPALDQAHLNILIVGAGSFPSYGALSKLLDSRKLSFTLIEPIATETDFFIKNFAKKAHNFTIFNGELKNFLKDTTQQFDLIYFEHPETMTVPIVLSKIGFSRFKRVTSFRESLPMLARVIKPNTVIIGTCMSRHELTQLKNLLNFSLKIKPLKIVSSLKHVFYGGPYCEGISFDFKKLEFCEKTQLKKTKHITFSDGLLVIVLFIGFMIYLFYCARFPNADHAPERLLAILLIGAQLHCHRPGKSGIFLKCILLGCQVLL